MTNNLNDLLSKLPIDSIAARLGEDPAKVRQASEQILSTLLAGMGANAQDPAGRESLASALDSHNPDLVEGDVNVDDIDTQDGAKIAHHVFGKNEDQVAHQLGGLVGGTSLVRALMPILAPLAMSWLAGRLTQGGGSQTQAQAPGKGGLLEAILGQVLGGGQAGQTQAQAPGGLGGVLGELLGGLLGGGRR
ncbi:DUF937 domain-containing protein [Corynebacterium sp.]|uniref:DUF937 domain-containing protein n=1 Tax=Corynebacterium sp. TaxID=1720 RepID=UPI0019C484F6|nr:DUF937 domain-containing protein [Corynebacterium sp.]HHU68151.1 DUF937 domain-containing protein [Corynebacterium sp.]